MQQAEDKDRELYRSGNKENRRLPGPLPEIIRKIDNANPARPAVSEHSLGKIIQDHCKKDQARRNELFEPSRARHLSETRKNIITDAVTTQAATIADIARHANRPEGTNSQAIKCWREKNV